MTENVPIRTLYVSPVKSNVRNHLLIFADPLSIFFQLTIIENLFIQIKNDIEKYFKQFGEVEKFRFVSKTKFFGYCFVQFETEESARAALANIKHRIGNSTVKVKPGDSQHQPDSENYLYSDSDSDTDYDDYYGNDYDDACNYDGYSS